MELDLTVFEQDISRMKVLELADWLVYCRNQVKRENFDTDSEYYENLKIFCDAWEKHYNKYEAFYTDAKPEYRSRFYKALVYTTVKDNITLVTKTYNEEVRCPIRSCEEINKVTIDTAGTIQAIENQTGYFYGQLYNVFAEENFTKYKEKLHDYISMYRFSSIEFQRYFVKDYVKRINANTYDELEELCNRIPHTVAIGVDYKRNNYEKGLRNYDIIKSVYSYFRSYDKCEKEFNKKMFVNLGFAIGLPLHYLELLMEYNGYSISEKSHRKFDQIIRMAFKCGFSRDMTIGLIEIENAKGFNIPNLTKNSTSG